METTQILYLVGAFVLGFIVAWFAGRGGPKRALEECEAKTHSLQRSLDERTRSVSKLETQLKEQIAQVNRLGAEKDTLAAAVKTAEEKSSDSGGELERLQSELDQAQSDRLLLEAELGHMRGVYADTRSRLAEMVSQTESAAAEAATAQEAQNETETTALVVMDMVPREHADELAAQVQSLHDELATARAAMSRLSSQVALRPKLTEDKQQEYAALAGDAGRVVAALHERDLAVADARNETDYLRRTVGMLSGMGAELSLEVERRRREQQLLLYEVAGLTAVNRDAEIKQLIDASNGGRALTVASSTAPAGTVEPETRSLPVTPPDNFQEDDDDLMPAAAAAAVALELSKQLEQRNQELEEIKTKSAPLQANLDELQAEIEALNAAEADLEAQLEARDMELTEIKEQLATLQTDAESASAAKADLKTELEMRAAELAEIKEQLATLQAEAESASMAKSGLEEQFQAHGVQWDNLLARIAALNVELSAINSDASDATETDEPSDEVAALAAAGIPEAARAADAAVPQEAEDSGESDAAEHHDPAADDQVGKLAAGVVAAVTLFKRKNAQITKYEQQLDSLNGAKSTLESTLTAKDQSLVSTQARLEELQAGLSQRSMRFDALSLHTSSLEADMEIRALERRKLEEQVRSVAADLQALAQQQSENGAPALQTADTAAEPTAAVGPIAPADQAADIQPEQPEQEESSLAALTAGAAAISELVRRQVSRIEDAQTQLTGMQTQLDSYATAKESLAAELKNKGASHAEVETKLQALQGEYEGVLAARTDLQAQLHDINEQLQDYLAQYSDDEQTEQPAADATPTEGDTGEPAAPAVKPGGALGGVTAIGALLNRSKDALNSANVRIGELEDEISALTSQKSDLEDQIQQSEQSLADVNAQLESAQATIAGYTSDIATLQHQLDSVQATLAATESERQRLDAQQRQLNDDLLQLGQAWDAGDETALESVAQKLLSPAGDAADAAAGDESAAATGDRRLMDAPLIKVGGAVAVAGAIQKKRAALRETSTQLEQTRQEQAELVAAKADLEAQLQSRTAALEAATTQTAALQEQLAETNAQIAALQEQLEAVKAQHADEVQALDAKTAELQAMYDQAETLRTQLEASWGSLTQDLQTLGAAVEEDDEGSLEQLLTRSSAMQAGELAGADAQVEPGESQTLSTAPVVAVATVAAALQSKQAALRDAGEQLAALQAQLAEVTADSEEAKALLAERDSALLEAENKLTAVPIAPEAPIAPVEKKVSDFKATARAAAEARGATVQTTLTLQDLAEIKHIGVTFEQRLYRAGAGTYWEVAHLTDDDFELILRLTEMQQLAMDLNEARTDAQRLAEETNTVGMLSEGETPDDFEPIPGIGKVFEQRLYSAGIRTYRDLANTSEEQLAQICKARKPLIPDYAAWIKQARLFVDIRGGGQQRN